VILGRGDLVLVLGGIRPRRLSVSFSGSVFRAAHRRRREHAAHQQTAPECAFLYGKKQKKQKISQIRPIACRAIDTFDTRDSVGFVRAPNAQ